MGRASLWVGLAFIIYLDLVKCLLAGDWEFKSLLNPRTLIMFSRPSKWTDRFEFIYLHGCNTTNVFDIMKPNQASNIHSPGRIQGLIRRWTSPPPKRWDRADSRQPKKGMNCAQFLREKIWNCRLIDHHFSKFQITAHLKQFSLSFLVLDQKCPIGYFWANGHSFRFSSTNLQKWTPNVWFWHEMFGIRPKFAHVMNLQVIRLLMLVSLKSEATR